MKLGLISVIRDEIDIAETFLNHVDALFDLVFFIDHQSVDGTSELLKQAVSQRPTWKYYFLNVKTYVQNEVSNLMIQEAFAEDIDYLFFLDADEFINVSSREELDGWLNRISNPPANGSLAWKNCICERFEESKFTEKTQLWVPPNESHFEKVILSKELFRKMEKNITVSAGNHSAFDRRGKRISATRIGTLLHVPVRSLKQVFKKVILTVISFRGYKERIPGNSFQFYKILSKIARGEFAEDDIRGFTIAYDMPNIKESAVSENDLKKWNYQLTDFSKLNIALSTDLCLKPARSDYGFERQVANALDQLETNIPNGTHLILTNNVIHIDESTLNQQDFEGKLSDDRISNLKDKDDENEKRIQLLEQEILKYEQSRSWRITLPLRKLNRFFKSKKI